MSRKLLKVRLECLQLRLKPVVNFIQTRMKSAVGGVDHSRPRSRSSFKFPGTFLHRISNLPLYESPNRRRAWKSKNYDSTGKMPKQSAIRRLPVSESSRARKSISPPKNSHLWAMGPEHSADGCSGGRAFVGAKTPWSLLPFSLPGSFVYLAAEWLLLLAPTCPKEALNLASSASISVLS